MSYLYLSKYFINIVRISMLKLSPLAFAISTSFADCSTVRRD